MPKPKTPAEIAAGLEKPFAEIDRLMAEAEKGLSKRDAAACTKALRESLAHIHSAAAKAKEAGRYDPAKVALQVANAFTAFSKCRATAIKRQIRGPGVADG